MWDWIDNLSRFQFACLVGLVTAIGVFVVSLILSGFDDPSYFAMIGGFIGGFIGGYRTAKREDDV